jgi:hypothetical protein
MRVLESGGEGDLAAESLRTECGGEVGVEQLQRDGAVVLRVAGEEDGGHAATAKLTLEEVPTPERVLQQLPRVAGWHVSQSTHSLRSWHYQSGVSIGYFRLARAGVGRFGGAGAGTSVNTASSTT